LTADEVPAQAVPLLNINININIKVNISPAHFGHIFLNGFSESVACTKKHLPSVDTQLAIYPRIFLPFLRQHFHGVGAISYISKKAEWRNSGNLAHVWQRLLYSSFSIIDPYSSIYHSQ